MIQVDKSNYRFERYVLRDRWLSYYNQIRESVADTGGGIPNSYLVIGAGDSIVPDVIRRVAVNTLSGTEPMIDTFDFDPALNPTYVGDLRHITDIVKKQYDCVLCCQVLEHLEWKFFEPVCGMLSEICGERLIMSLPMQRLPFAITVETPWFIKSLQIIIEKSWKSQIPPNGQHYWEVGIKEHRKKDILRVVKKHFDVSRDYISPGNSYHWFIIAQKQRKL